MKEGTILLLGRPNVGKSTFVNNLIGQKVAITSPKPQTTRFPIKAIYTEERGNLIFVDTPGIFGRVQDSMSKKINELTLRSANQEVTAVIYMVDHTRRRDFEESKVLGIIRKVKAPKILVINKMDIQEPSYLPQYKFLEEEFDHIYEISALNRQHMKPLIDELFELSPEVSESSITEEHIYPLLNMDSYTFVGELVREKIFLKTGKEVPYTSMVLVDEITERVNGPTYIKARIITSDDRYKKMIIGEGGRKIKEIGSMSRKEIELAINKKVYLDLTVESDPHWQEVYYK